MEICPVYLGEHPARLLIQRQRNSPNLRLNQISVSSNAPVRLSQCALTRWWAAPARPPSPLQFTPVSILPVCNLFLNKGKVSKENPKKEKCRCLFFPRRFLCLEHLPACVLPYNPLPPVPLLFTRGLQALYFSLSFTLSSFQLSFKRLGTWSIT